MSTTTLIILIAAGVAILLAVLITRALTRSSMLAAQARLESDLENARKDVLDAENAKDAVI